MRLIDADAMMKRLEEWNTSDSIDKALYNFALDRVLEAPTIEERKTGRWIGHKADDPDWQRDDGTPVFLECSACQAFVINNGAANWNYCPNCGSYNGGKK